MQRIPHQPVPWSTTPRAVAPAAPQDSYPVQTNRLGLMKHDPCHCMTFRFFRCLPTLCKVYSKCPLHKRTLAPCGSETGTCFFNSSSFIYITSYLQHGVIVTFPLLSQVISQWWPEMYCAFSQWPIFLRPIGITVQSKFNSSDRSISGYTPGFDDLKNKRSRESSSSSESLPNNSFHFLMLLNFLTATWFVVPQHTNRNKCTRRDHTQHVNPPPTTTTTTLYTLAQDIFSFCSFSQFDELFEYSISLKR